jgi:hypothetical protein
VEATGVNLSPLVTFLVICVFLSSRSSIGAPQGEGAKRGKRAQATYRRKVRAG